MKKLPFTAHLGKVCREMREKDGISLEKFAQIMDCDKSQVSRMERGVQEYKAGQILSVAIAFKTTVTAIVHRAEMRWRGVACR
jgi:transcriptional regulator with XRE-family HTH domain